MANYINSTSPKTLGERIRFLRTKRGWSLLRLAAELDVDKSTVSRWERDESEPNYVMVECLAQLLDTTPYYIMFGERCFDDDYHLDLNGLTFRQIALVKQLVEEFRTRCTLRNDSRS